MSLGIKDDKQHSRSRRRQHLRADEAFSRMNAWRGIRSQKCVALAAATIWLSACGVTRSTSATVTTPQSAATAVAATPVLSPTSSSRSVSEAGRLTRAMLASKLAHSWAKSAHASFSTPLASRKPNAVPSNDSNGAPSITKLDVTPSIVHGGDIVRRDVRTTANVVSVAAHVTLATLQLQRAEPGHFVLSFAIPQNAPGLFHGTYNVDVSATATDGAIATKTISMTFQ